MAIESLKSTQSSTVRGHCRDNARSTKMVHQETSIAKQVNESLMVRSIIWYARLGRFFGCLFIRNLSDKSLDKASATWKSFYSLYSALWLSMLVFFEGNSILEAYEYCTERICKFTESLGVVSHVAATLKMLVNLICLACGTAKLLAFLKDAVAFERSNSLLPTYWSMVRSRSWHNMILKLAVIASLVTTLGFAIAVHIRSFSSRRQDWHPALKFLDMCSCFTFIVYESFTYLTLTRFCEVLEQYVKVQTACLEECKTVMTVTSASVDRMALARIEAARLNICKIKVLKKSLNDIWAPAIVTSSVCLLVMLCNGLYASFHIAADQVEAWSGVTYTVYCTLCFADMVLVSDQLGNQLAVDCNNCDLLSVGDFGQSLLCPHLGVTGAHHLKDTAKALTMLESTENYSRQVHYFHDAINPEEMYISAAGFCRLDRPVLVTMAWSVITFTVILVQTSDQLRLEIGTSG